MLTLKFIQGRQTETDIDTDATILKEEDLWNAGSSFQSAPLLTSNFNKFDRIIVDSLDWMISKLLTQHPVSADGCQRSSFLSMQSLQQQLGGRGHRLAFTLCVIIFRMFQLRRRKDEESIIQQFHDQRNGKLHTKPDWTQQAVQSVWV
ncbi:Hypothetical predicted protein [Scomber scombrus]|uniref:Uncharacterized protein n=1 Tax=Scomber scombrus TaxID=13677 RepID=A0AAV1PBT2_SCOSC